MPLPSDYDSPDGEAAAEVAIRTAIRDIFVGVGSAYLFDADHSHLCPRYPDTMDEWNRIGTVEDPDTVAQPPENKRRLVRYFAVKYVGMRRTRVELTLAYDIEISMGFKDAYASDTSLRSYNQLTELNMKFGKTLADNQELGLDERVSHNYLQMTSRPNWTPVDEQGESTVTIGDSLAVVLKVC